ncbi:hypothetical protein L211DRAFT_603277 [Terfezia boudieri ATCC MYA-4762]|uniref:Uncharacterized protein n=1 Tax=Terfezia boudieri ATCC MYA-4762 TaxID=1051890 RepID=A0A3N4M251_9PEZI|nr:hypothetical protein L211DRAFT_603277 [Terfezia boudieri ATCC MYA-4762]
MSHHRTCMKDEITVLIASCCASLLHSNQTTFTHTPGLVSGMDPVSSALQLGTKDGGQGWERRVSGHWVPVWERGDGRNR